MLARKLIVKIEACDGNSDIMISNICGYIAGFLYVICYIPQIYSIYKSESMHLSCYFMLLQLIAACLMSVYGILENLQPIYLLNIISASLLLAILYGMYKNREQLQRHPPLPPPVYHYPEL